MPAERRGGEEPPVLSLSRDDFLDLARELLARTEELRFRADGVSMAPQLLPGDTLCVTPLCGVAPRPGQVVLAAAGQVPLAHRVLARRGKGDRGLLVTRGDAVGRGPDPILPLKDVLGIVVAYERGGESHPTPALAVPRLLRWRACWWLFLHGTGLEGSALEGLVHGVARACRWAGRGLGALALAARRWPLVGGLLGALLPEVGTRCVVVAVVRDDGRGSRTHCLDAALGSRSIAQVLLWRSAALSRGPGEGVERWWMTGVRTVPRYRGRGVTDRLLPEALARARQEGAGEVLALLSPEELAEAAAFARLGFQPLAREELATEVGEGILRETAPPPVTILRLPFPEAETPSA